MKLFLPHRVDILALTPRLHVSKEAGIWLLITVEVCIRDRRQYRIISSRSSYTIEQSR